MAGRQRTPDVVCQGGAFDPNCPRCGLQPIVFEWESDPACHFCGASLRRRATPHEHDWEAIGDPGLSAAEQMWRCRVCGEGA